MNTTTGTKTPSPVAAWLKRIGIGGLLFFFLKGMAWLAVLGGMALLR